MIELTEYERCKRRRDKAIETAKRLNTVILDEMPDGWRDLHGATQPLGTFWAGHGSRFDGTYEHALVWDEDMKDNMRRLGIGSEVDE
jgi:hypothetical protein